DEGQIGNDDLVAGADAYRLEGQVECGRPARDSDGMFRAHERGELAFELGRDTAVVEKIALQHGQDLVALLAAHAGLPPRDPVTGRHTLSCLPRSSAAAGRRGPPAGFPTGRPPRLRWESRVRDTP